MKINKTILSAVLATAALGFTASANAAFPAAEASCPNCHGIIINGIQAVGSGGRNCAQRSEAAWATTIREMDAKGCPNITDVLGMAKYLASIGTATTTTRAPTTTTTAPTTTTTAPTTTTTATTAVQTTTTAPIGHTTTTAAITTTTAAAITTTTAAAITTTTVATTTTTTAATPGCNTYVNGTTQYKYSGKGSCHGHSDDPLAATGHIVRDQSWCQKHMSHQNNKGNHTHAYPHPTCM